MTSPTDARRVVIGCAVLAGAATAINDATKRKSLPHVAIPIAAAAAAAVLSAVSDFAPAIAMFLAISLAVTALLNGGTNTAAFLTRITTPPGK